MKSNFRAIFFGGRSVAPDEVDRIPRSNGDAIVLNDGEKQRIVTKKMPKNWTGLS